MVGYVDDETIPTTIYLEDGEPKPIPAEWIALGVGGAILAYIILKNN